MDINQPERPPMKRTRKGKDPKDTVEAKRLRKDRETRNAHNKGFAWDCESELL